MIRALLLAATLFVGLAQPAAAADKMKPFILAEKVTGNAAAVVEATKAKLTAAGFEIAGSYSPYDGVTIIAVTNDELKATAAKTEFGGYGAAQRVSVTQAGGEVQVAFTNPSYMAAAYRMDGNMSGVKDALGAALGSMEEYGTPDGLTDDDLRDYHYKFMMPYFDDPDTINKFDSYDAAVAAMEAGLAKGVSGVTKVYRIDIPGKEETVFGIGMNGAKGTGNMQDDTYIMSQIDFKDLKNAAHLPYEVLVSGKKVYALSAKFRIAINFPDLSMMGSNSFMSIMDSPAGIKKALIRASGREPDEYD